MLDFIGNKLYIGDYVAFTDNTTSNTRTTLLKGEIISFTPKKVRIRFKHPELLIDKETTRTFEGVCKIVGE